MYCTKVEARVREKEEKSPGLGGCGGPFDLTIEVYLNRNNRHNKRKRSKERSIEKVIECT